MVLSIVPSKSYLKFFHGRKLNHYRTFINKFMIGLTKVFHFNIVFLELNIVYTFSFYRNIFSYSLNPFVPKPFTDIIQHYAKTQQAYV